MRLRFPSRRRLILLTVCGVVAVAAAIACLDLYFARPVGEGPAGPAVELAAFERPWGEREVLLLGIGDSVTAGLGARSSDHSYFRRLAQNPPDEFSDMRGRSLAALFPQLRTTNLAISGSTSLEHLQVLEQRLQVQSPDVFGLVLMTTGGNDLIHSYGRLPPREGAMYGATLVQAQPWIEGFARRLDRMLDRIDECFPGGCVICLADIYDPTDGVGDAPSVYLPRWRDGLQIHATYNQIIHRAAEQRANVFLVPLHQAFLGHGSHCRQFWRTNYRAEDPHYWYYYNIEDPNDRGYDAIRRLFLNTILGARATITSQTAPTSGGSADQGN